MTQRAGPRRVVIVGGGFAGLFAARALRRSPVEVTLIDRAQHHLFQPLLYQCATGILSEGQIAAPLRDVLRRHKNAECVMAEVTGIDAESKRLIGLRPGGGRIEVGYDHLIVAAGVRLSYFGHDEFARFAPGMKTIADALTIRRRVFGAFEMAETATDDAERLRWLTFALVGAGPTGVELAGQIRELATKTLRAEFHHVRPEDARVLLFDGGSAPGVTTRHDAGTVLWTAGVEAPPFAEALANATGAKRDRAGRIVVEENLTIPGHPEISVTGDLMSLGQLPGVAEVAMQSGLYAGRRIRREVTGRGAAKPFRYHDLGLAAYISRGRAVISAGPLHFGGFLGWIAWLFIHIAFLTGYRNRVGAILTWWLAFTRDRRRERAFTTREVGAVADIYAPTSAPPTPSPSPPVTE